MLLDELTEKPSGGYQRIAPFCQLNIRDTTAISRAAFIIYQQSDIYISSKTENILITLMAMDMGEEFELSEQEFCDLLSELPES